MSNAPAKFHQVDVSRAIKANVATGLTHVIEIDRNGVIRLVPAALRPAPPMNEDAKEIVEDARLESWD